MTLIALAGLFLAGCGPEEIQPEQLQALKQSLDATASQPKEPDPLPRGRPRNAPEYRAARFADPFYPAETSRR